MSVYGSDLVLKAVRVEDFIFKINEESDLYNIEDVKISIVPVPKVNFENNNLGRLDLEVRLFDEYFIENNEPFYLKMVIVGLFEDKGKREENQDIFDMYLPNSISMLYSYARSNIAALTGMFGIDQIQLPTINVIKLLEKWIESKSLD